MRKRSRLAKASDGSFWDKVITRPRCPFCSARFSGELKGNTYLNDKGEVLRVKNIWQMRNAKFQECASCKERWPLYAEDEDTHFSVGRIIETSRSEEHIGNESRRIENDTLATIQRTIRASREWASQIEVGFTNRSQNSTTISATIKGVGVTSEVQKSIQNQYGVTIGETKTFEEEVTITIPAHISIEAVMSWKRIWQNGYFESETGEEKVPFRLCIGLTFDLRQRHIPNT